MKYLLKTWYKLIPYKKYLYRLLRPLLRKYPNIYQHLHFESEINIELTNHNCFKIIHNGYRVENELFWAGFGHSWEGSSLLIWIRIAKCRI